MSVVKANRAERRARKFKLAELRKQAIEASGQLAGIEVETEDGSSFHIPHPLMLDDDAQERVERHNRGEGLDRVTILDPETKKPLKDETGEVITRIRVPHKINGKELEPEVIRSAKAILGEEEYARFKAAGGQANDVHLAWSFMVSEYKEAEEEDPNS